MSNKTKPISFIISSPAADARSRLPQRRVTVDDRVIKVGSHAKSQVHIDDPTVERTHGVIEQDQNGDVWWIDCGTITGSLVDGMEVGARGRHKRKIGNGSFVQIGRTRIDIEIPSSAGDATGSIFPVAVVENTMERVKLWDAIALVIGASGGDAASSSVAKQNAVVSVEKAIDDLIKRACARARFLERTRAGGDPATAGPLDPLAVFDLISFFDEKRRWSEETFGPGDRYTGVVEHIRKELDEILEKPDDLVEWIDVVLLAMDGAWRSAGADGERFVRTLTEKQEKNTRRSWPDWRTLKPNQVSEHVAEASPTGNGAVPAVERLVHRAESEKVRRALEVTRDERDQLRATMRKAREYNANLEERLKNILVSVAELGKDLSSRDAALRNLQKKYDESQKGVEDARKENDRLTEEVARLRALPAGEADQLRGEVDRMRLALSGEEALRKGAELALATETKMLGVRSAEVREVAQKLADTSRAFRALVREVGVAMRFLFQFGETNQEALRMARQLNEAQTVAMELLEKQN